MYRLVEAAYSQTLPSQGGMYEESGTTDRSQTVQNSLYDQLTIPKYDKLPIPQTEDPGNIYRTTRNTLPQEQGKIDHPRSNALQQQNREITMYGNGIKLPEKNKFEEVKPILQSAIIAHKKEDLAKRLHQEKSLDALLVNNV